MPPPRLQVHSRFGILAVTSPSHDEALTAAPGEASSSSGGSDGSWTAQLSLGTDACDNCSLFKDFVLELQVPPSGGGGGGPFAWTEVTAAPLGAARGPAHSALLEVPYDW